MITVNIYYTGQNGSNEWLEKVSDEDYNKMN